MMSVTTMERIGEGLPTCEFRQFTGRVIPRKLNHHNAVNLNKISGGGIRSGAFVAPEAATVTIAKIGTGGTILYTGSYQNVVQYFNLAMTTMADSGLDP